MKKRTAALTLVLIGPTLIAGCYSRNSTARNDDCDPDKEDCNNRRGGGYYGGGGFYGGGVGRARSNGSGGSSSVDSGGFGSTGRSYSSGS